MNGGALDSRFVAHLQARSHPLAATPKGFGWEERATILLHTARGLVNLHSLNPPLIHRDVKCGNGKST
jgi:hypothetical protein